MTEGNRLIKISSVPLFIKAEFRSVKKRLFKGPLDGFSVLALVRPNLRNDKFTDNKVEAGGRYIIL